MFSEIVPFVRAAWAEGYVIDYGSRFASRDVNAQVIMEQVHPGAVVPGFLYIRTIQSAESSAGSPVDSMGEWVRKYFNSLVGSIHLEHGFVTTLEGRRRCSCIGDGNLMLDVGHAIINRWLHSYILWFQNLPNYN